MIRNLKLVTSFGEDYTYDCFNMVNGIADSGVVQHFKINKHHFLLKRKIVMRKIRVVLINSSTCSKAFTDFGYFLCVIKTFQYLYRNAYHKLSK